MSGSSYPLSSQNEPCLRRLTRVLGRAITIRRLPEILKIDKQEYPIGAARADANQVLWFVGEHLFSVKKLATDPPHWSDDGH